MLEPDPNYREKRESRWPTVDSDGAYVLGALWKLVWSRPTWYLALLVALLFA